MTIRERIQDLDKQRAALAEEIAKVESARRQALAALPAKFGYKDVSALIVALKDAVTPAKAVKPRKTYSRNVTRPVRSRKVTPVEVAPRVVVANVATLNVVVAEPVQVVAPIDVHEPVARVGSDLSDPVNFGLLPDTTLLDPAAADFEGAHYVEKLTKALAFAKQVLATSKVAPAVWREWRDFERQVTEILRGRHRQVLPDAE